MNSRMFLLIIPLLYNQQVLGSIESSLESVSKYPQYSPGGAACTNKHIGDSLRGLAPCQPRDKVIPVPWPNNTDIHQLSPSHVVVQRCSGGCHTSSRNCVSTSTQVRRVQVMMGRCPVGGGKCEKECAVLEVEDEVECSCGCSKHDHDQCEEKRSSHSWNRESCECECRDQSLQRQCLESPGKLWDSSSCSCICQHQESCHTGLIFNPDSCLCEPTATIIDAVETGAVVREDRDNERKSAIYEYFLKNWIEVIIIISLAICVVILCIICAALLRKIHKLKTIIHNSKTSHVKVASNLYSPCPVSQFESQPIKASPIIKPVSQLEQKHGSDKVLELYSSDSSEVSSERQTDCSYYTDTSLTLTPPPPCSCFQPRPLDMVSECSTLLGRETNV